MSSSELPTTSALDDLPSTLAAATHAVQVAKTANQLPENCHLGPYVLQAELGRGAMGTVYQAVHTKLKRTVALKVLPVEFSSSETRRNRFLREMEAVGRLDHPNIVRATDAGEQDGTHYIVMELVDGIDLHKLLNLHGHLDCEAASEIIRQAALGLHHIYENHLVHRDIKPSNLIVSRNGQIKILDLGIARLRDSGESSTLTLNGGLMGTPDFIAPEQITQTGSVDIRADIYSLGCTLYNLLSGRAPFEGPDFDTQVAKLIAHTRQDAEDLSTLAPGVPSELVGLVRAMMAKDPADRVQTPGELAARLEAWADATALQPLLAELPARKAVACPSTIPNSTPSESHGTSLRRPEPSWRRWVFGVAAVLLALLVAGMLIPSAGDSDDAALRDTQLMSDLETTTEPSAVQSIADNTEAISGTTKQIAEVGIQIQQNTEHMAAAIDELRETFAAAASRGGIIALPQTLGELYHNARTYARQGQNVLARESYLQLVESGLPWVDIHLRFQEFLVAQEGTGGALRRYLPLAAERPDDTVYQWAVARLQPLAERRASLTAILEQDPDFAPAVYELSHTFSAAARGSQTLTEGSRERELLTRFRELHEQGQLLRHFLDQADASKMLSDAELRLQSLASNSGAIAKPVQVEFMPHNQGWTVYFRLAEPAREILYRSSDGPFKSTGFAAHVDPRTQSPAPVSLITLPAAGTPDQLDVKYVDLRGQECGPFTFEFNADSETKQWKKRTLERTAGSWLRFVDDKLYFTHLAAYGEAIAAVRYGLDRESPDRDHSLPDLNRGETTEGLFVTVPAETRFAVVQITFFDGTSSDVLRVARP